jgi:cell division protein FtsL|tara:strand:- start:1681 stop:1986 length:306 start_codon:yes stop_codon:yes gene_type:complete
MKKFSVIFLIVFLILSTALVKNSTKRTDDEIFTIKENIRALKKDFENIKLEYEFLSSTEKLLEFQNLYFDDELVKKDINEIKIIDQSTKKLQINNLILGNE